VALIQKLAEYLAEVTGADLQVKVPEGGYDINLPLFLKAMYKLHTVDLFERPLVLAFQTGRKEERTPAEYEGHLNQLRGALHRHEVAFVLPDVPSYVRNRLVRKGIPFIVPGRQLFLPMFLVDLRERFPPRRVETAGHVSWAAQAVVLYHILKKPAPDVSLRLLAEKTGYSAMTLSNVAAELADLDVCEIRASGKSCHISFRNHGRELWAAMEPRFRAPNMRKRWVKAGGPIKGALPAGLTALASLTSINDDPVPTVAMREGEYRKLIEGGAMAGCHSRMEADTGVECWGYDPKQLADGGTVDKLSLYLTLKGGEAERVGKELGIMMEGMAW
jgi:hypothetical protein